MSLARIFPSELKGRVDDQTYKRIIELYSMIYDLSDQLNSNGSSGLTRAELLAIRNAL